MLILGHRDDKTTIKVYNSVDNEYICQTTDNFNEKIKEDQLFLNEQKRQEEIENQKIKLISNMKAEEFDDLLEQLFEERKARRNRQKDFEM